MLTYVTVLLGVYTLIRLTATAAHASDRETKESVLAAIDTCLVGLGFVFMLLSRH